MSGGSQISTDLPESRMISSTKTNNCKSRNFLHNVIESLMKQKWTNSKNALSGPLH